METICKLYLELANVVPRDCVSSRERSMQKHIDRYGIALMMIEKGCANPAEVAYQAIRDYQNETRED